MMTIVRVGQDDAGLVLRSAALFDHAPTPEYTATFLASSGHHLLIALCSDEPVGFVTGVEMTHPDKGTEMFVYELGTAETHRRQGVATTLLAELADIAVDRGCYGMWVDTEPDNEAAHATYRSAGFTSPRTSTTFERRLAAQPPA